jgi:hypothetical protein
MGQKIGIEDSNKILNIGSRMWVTSRIHILTWSSFVSYSYRSCVFSYGNPFK